MEQTILRAEEGMVYTNGEAYVKTVILPKNVDSSVWVLVSEEDIPNEENMATAEDYQKALAEMGVKL